MAHRIITPLFPLAVLICSLGTSRAAEISQTQFGGATPLEWCMRMAESKIARRGDVQARARHVPGEVVQPTDRPMACTLPPVQQATEGRWTSSQVPDAGDWALLLVLSTTDALVK